MLDTSITSEQKKYAWDLVCRINYGKRGKFDGDKTKQYTGILGEVCFADLYNLPRPVAGKQWDYGIDFTIAPHLVDLKTMGHNHNMNYETNFCHNLVRSQVDHQYSKTTAYVFAAINKTKSVFTVIGYTTKWYIQNHCAQFDKGQTVEQGKGSFINQMDNYLVRFKDLFEADMFLVHRISTL